MADLEGLLDYLRLGSLSMKNWLLDWQGGKTRDWRRPRQA